jgi:hypothetical protein
VAAQLDKEFGLGMPVFAFGYQKMRRCISYRSTKRVTTHLVLSLGKGHSIESYVQALGRSTFNGKDSVLKANNHQYVTVLTSELALAMASRYYKFVDEIHALVLGGVSLEDAITGAKGTLSASAIFFLATKRRVIPQKKTKAYLHLDPDKLFSSVHHDDDSSHEESDFVCSYVEDNNEGHIAKKMRYWDHKVAQRVLKAFSDLKEEDRKFLCTTKHLWTTSMTRTKMMTLE